MNLRQALSITLLLFSSLTPALASIQASEAAIDAAGAIVMIRPHRDTADFGTGPVASAGATDILIVKFAP